MGQERYRNTERRLVTLESAAPGPNQVRDQENSKKRQTRVEYRAVAQVVEDSRRPWTFETHETRAEQHEDDAAPNATGRPITQTRTFSEVA
jgi:hypothetical protein